MDEGFGLDPLFLTNLFQDLFECPALVAHAEKRGTTSESDEGSSEGTVGTVFVPSETVFVPSETSNSVKRKEFELLESHRDKLEPSSLQTISYTRLGHALSSYVSHGAPDTNKLLELRLGSAKDIVDLLSKFSANAHTLSTPSLTPIGVALSPVAALINHSCVPNCVVVFPKASETKKVPNEMLIIAIGKIPRTEILQERYFFKCHCPNCETTSLVKTPYVDSRRALRCASKSCEGFLPMPRLDDSKLKKTEVQCLQCNIVYYRTPGDRRCNPARRRRARKGGGTSILCLTLCAGLLDPERAFKYTSNLIPMVSRFFHPSAHPLLALSRLHLSLLISRLDLDRSILDEAIRAAARVAAGISAVLPAGHPVRAVTYAELGKLLAVDDIILKDRSLPNPPRPTRPQGQPNLGCW
ncbi:SET and MYND domain protein [Rhizoctonia solani]|uniref:SET and MYND domain protein n=1 Tax=Rhizoctonia solani TaxID=456999 RepID=A0A8H8SZE5_9AGAM|nr:SET and MYND domain protein [Rhizoctonia solani]QRW23334.1 SET and MYND domain protein [Rhizoctonia solani]